METPDNQSDMEIDDDESQEFLPRSSNQSTEEDSSTSEEDYLTGDEEDDLATSVVTSEDERMESGGEGNDVPMTVEDALPVEHRAPSPSSSDRVAMELSRSPDPSDPEEPGQSVTIPATAENLKGALGKTFKRKTRRGKRGKRGNVSTAETQDQPDLDDASSKRKRRGKHSQNWRMKHLGKVINMWDKTDTYREGKTEHSPLRYKADATPSDVLLDIAPDFLNAHEKRPTAQSLKRIIKDALVLEEDSTRRAPEEGVFLVRAKPPQASEQGKQATTTPASTVPPHTSTPAASAPQSSETDASQEERARTARDHGVEPRYAVIRVPGVLNKDEGDVVVAAVHAFEARGPTPAKKCSRSKTAKARHVGTWSKFSKQPFLSSDAKSQSDEVKKDLDTIAMLVANKVCQPVMRLLQTVDPDYAKMVSRCGVGLRGLECALIASP